ncbi:hypothetical protein MITS9508_01589 [Synechococcus sp. MIT S9508]|nr:hypothetical protein MITS9508_01589 [Synechococcus sp. MIT S9508]
MHPRLRDRIGAEARVREIVAQPKQLSPQPLLKFQRNGW